MFGIKSMDNAMHTTIKEIYELGLEKCAGDAEKAKEFTVGFIKEAFGFNNYAFAKELSGGVGKAVGGAAVGLGAGLAIHGVSSLLNRMGSTNLRQRFEEALKQAIAGNAILQNAKVENPQRLVSFSETIFQFAPHVAGDPNLLAHILSGVIHGESMDLTTVRSLADLENRYQENKKNSLFTPKSYV